MSFRLSRLSHLNDRELCDLASKWGVELSPDVEEPVPGKFLLKDRSSLLLRIEQRWRDRQVRKSILVAYVALAVALASAVISLVGLFRK